MGSALIALRILIHRRLTHLKGHWSVEVMTKTGSGPWIPSKGSVLAHFVSVSAGFSLVQGVFLAVVIGVTASSPLMTVDVAALEKAVPMIALFLILGFLQDLAGIRRRPFAWIRHLTETALQRTIVIQLVLMVGMTLVPLLHAPRLLLAVFFGLKLLTDLSTWVPQWNPEEPPAWMARAADKIGSAKGERFADYWKRTRQEEQESEADDERPV